VARVNILAVFLVCAVLAVYDGQLLFQSMSQEPATQTSWSKVALACVIQCAAVVGELKYVSFVLAKANSTAGVFLQSLSWRVKWLPLFACGVLLGFSVVLLENGLLCGNEPLPSVRGHPVCTR